jgi:hypothetical protein
VREIVTVAAFLAVGTILPGILRLFLPVRTFPGTAVAVALFLPVLYGIIFVPDRDAARCAIMRTRQPLHGFPSIMPLKKFVPTLLMLTIFTSLYCSRSRT